LLRKLHQGGILLPRTTGTTGTQNRLKDSETQTMETEALVGDSAMMVLDRKLNRVSERYSMLAERDALAPRKSTEERMISYQRECDKRAQARIESELDHFKSTELANMRTLERAQQRREFSKLKESFHREHQAKLREIEKRQSALAEQAQRQEMHMEAELYRDRQTLLTKLEENQKRSEHELRRLELEKLAAESSMREAEKLKQDLEKQKSALDQAESERKVMFEEEKRAFRLAVLSDFEQRERRISLEESRIAQDKRQIAQVEEQVQARLEAAQNISSDLEAARKELGEVKLELEELRIKAKTFEDQVAFVQGAASHDRKRYDDLYQQFVEQSKTLEAFRKDEHNASSLDHAQKREQLIGKLRDELAKNKTILEEQTQQYERQLQEFEHDHTFEVQSLTDQIASLESTYHQKLADVKDRLLFAEQELESCQSERDLLQVSNRSLKAECDDMRKLLGQAREALDEEVHNPKPKALGANDRASASSEESRCARAAMPPPPPPPPMYHPFSVGAMGYPHASYIDPSFFAQMPVPRHQGGPGPEGSLATNALELKLEQMQSEMQKLLQAQKSTAQTANMPSVRPIEPTTECSSTGCVSTEKSIALGTGMDSNSALVNETSADSGLRPVSHTSSPPTKLEVITVDTKLRVNSPETSYTTPSDSPLESFEASRGDSHTSEKSPAKPDEAGLNEIETGAEAGAGVDEREQAAHSPVVLRPTKSSTPALPSDHIKSPGPSEELPDAPKEDTELSNEDEEQTEQIEQNDTSEKDEDVLPEVDPDEEARRVLQAQRAAQERQRKLQLQRQQENRRRLLEAEEEQRRQEMEREMERERAAAEAAKREAEVAAQNDEELQRKLANDAIIQEYREKAKAKLGVTSSAVSPRSPAGSQVSSHIGSPSTAEHQNSLASSLASSQHSFGGGSISAAENVEESGESEGWGFS